MDYKFLSTDNFQDICEEHSRWLLQQGGKRANFSGFNLDHMNLSGPNLAFARFEGASMRFCSCNEAKLSGANFDGVNLTSSNLSFANLSGAIFTGSCLDGVNFNNALADRSYFCGSSLDFTSFRKASLLDSHFGNTDLSTADLQYILVCSLHIKTLSVGNQFIAYTKNSMQIGAHHHSLQDWSNFYDEYVLTMSNRDLYEFWINNRENIFKIIDLFPAEGGISGD